MLSLHPCMHSQTNMLHYIIHLMHVKSGRIEERLRTLHVCTGVKVICA